MLSETWKCEIIKARDLRQFFCSIHGSPGKKAYHMENILFHHMYRREKVIMLGDVMIDYEAAMEVENGFLGYVEKMKENISPKATVIIEDLKSLIK